MIAAVARAKRVQLTLVPIVYLFAIALFAPDAEAKLRSPQLERSCPAGFTYGEMTNGPWRIEGCSKGVNPQDSGSTNETLRVLFSGTVELNGMLIEGSENLIVTKSSPALNQARQSITAGQLTTYRVKRGGGSTIVIDREAGGTIKRDEIYHGRVDFSAGSSKKVKDKTEFEFDIPVDSGAKINGMRLREPIRGASVVRGGAEQTLSPDDLRAAATVQTSDAVIEFKGKLSLASSVSSIFRDWTSPNTFKLIDGEGLQTNNIQFRIGEIVVPGIGGFKDFSITYNAVRDEWTGTVDLDLGELFPLLEFGVTVNGTTGALVRIEAQVSGLRIPIGNTGATLREVSGFFEPNPLVFGGGVGATYGPQIRGFYLVEITGTLEIQLEPNFRLEAEGAARVLPTGPNRQLARGTSNILIDSRGLLAVGADAQISVDIGGGIGAEARAYGSGAFSTRNSRFNIEAGITGELHLGFLGDFTVARIEGVISSEGWGTCAQLLKVLKGGIGQEWNDNVKVFTGCDLSEFSAPINTSVTAAAAGQKQFVVGPNVDKINVEINGAGPEPKAVLQAPGGENVVTTAVLGKRDVGNDVSVIALAGQSKQMIGVKNPKPGIWRVGWGNSGPEVSSIRIARSIDPLTASVSVRDDGGPGQRRISIGKLAGVAGGERVTLGVKTAAGIVPLGDTTGGAIAANFADQDAGRREIVAIPYRDGIPNPGRMRTLGSYTSRMPGAAKSLKAKRKGRSVKVTALLSKGGLKPDAWVYILRSNGKPLAVKRGKPGKNVTFTLPTGAKKLSIAARPVVAGRVLKVTQKTTKVKG